MHFCGVTGCKEVVYNTREVSTQATSINKVMEPMVNHFLFRVLLDKSRILLGHHFLENLVKQSINVGLTKLFH